nr:hypothetical protein Iba_chr05cCG7820 [Ipomoea batatas]
MSYESKILYGEAQPIAVTFSSLTFASILHKVDEVTVDAGQLDAAADFSIEESISSLNGFDSASISVDGGVTTVGRLAEVGLLFYFLYPYVYLNILLPFLPKFRPSNVTAGSDSRPRRWAATSLCCCGLRPESMAVNCDLLLRLWVAGCGLRPTNLCIF